MSSFLKKLVNETHDVSFNELDVSLVGRIKQLILDRLGCYLGSWKLGLHTDFVNCIKNYGGAPEATIWVDGARVPAHNAALVIGTISSRIEFDSHDSVVPAAFTLGEMLHKDGKSLITAIASALYVKKAITEILASSIESHGLHWPSFTSVFPATMVSSILLGYSSDRITHALSFSGCLSPISPFEPFTQGAPVKDMYGGWGDMIGVLSARMNKSSFNGGPPTIIEGKRGLGRAFTHDWINKDVMRETIKNCKKLKNSDIHLKPYPTCTSVHPTLSALENLFKDQPNIDTDNIERIRVDTYNYAVELSNESNIKNPISLKLNIPYLCAAMLVYKKIDIEHTEYPFINSSPMHEKIMRLAKKIVVNTLTNLKGEQRNRKRSATIEIIMRDGERHLSSVDEPKWRDIENLSNSDIEEKFSILSGNLLSEQAKKNVIKKVWSFEKISDIGDLIQNLR
jgi:2-methylcitrate dehydratase PrpD